MGPRVAAIPRERRHVKIHNVEVGLFAPRRNAVAGEAMALAAG